MLATFFLETIRKGHFGKNEPPPSEVWLRACSYTPKGLQVSPAALKNPVNHIVLC